jgi:hypothetical protein
MRHILFLARQRHPHKRMCPLCLKPVKGKALHLCSATDRNPKDVRVPRWIVGYTPSAAA